MPLQNLEWETEIPLSGQTVYPVCQAKAEMRIPDSIIKSVGFVSLYQEDASGWPEKLEYGGAAFVVGVRMGPSAFLAHLVTARHVAEAIEPAEAIIAMNAKDGAPRFLRTGEARWFYHPTKKNSVDIAVLPFGSAGIAQYDYTWIPEEIFATDERIAEYDIGLGDEVIVVGLFTQFFGSTHLIPIVRSGNIAMMPKDRIPIKGFGEMEAYLAETRSIGGLSGSPVFVRNTVNLPVQTGKSASSHISGLGSLHLLGLMHGHWDLPVSFSESQRVEAVNMGVSIVVPAKKIREVLHHPELAAMRKEYFEKQQEKEPNSPTTDSSFAQPFTQDDFDAALKKASRKLFDEK